MTVEATLSAATQLRLAVRQAGVVGMPGIRMRHVPEKGPEAIELTVEDRREPGDEVFESRGIRFYVDDRTASRFQRATLDLDGTDYVLRAERPTGGS